MAKSLKQHITDIPPEWTITLADGTTATLTIDGDTLLEAINLVARKANNVEKTAHTLGISFTDGYRAVLTVTRHTTKSKYRKEQHNG